MKKLIQIATVAGDPVEVIAEVRGALALHGTRGVVQNEYRWRISHVPTGYMAVDCKTAQLGRAALKKLNALPIDWPNVTAENVKKIPSDLRLQIHAIQAEAIGRKLAPPLPDCTGCRVDLAGEVECCQEKP